MSKIDPKSQWSQTIREVSYARNISAVTPATRQLLLIFHSDLQFLSANPTLYGLVIEQRPIFGPQGAS